MKQYNNIVLPDIWPPKPVESTLDKVVPTYYKKPEVIDVSIGRQLFVDDFLISESDLQRIFHQPRVLPQALFVPETDLELNEGYCATACPFNDGIFYDSDEKKFKMWYQAGWFDATAYADSEDGIHWKRLHEVYPDRETDRVIEREFGTMRDGSAVWLDYNAKSSDEKFKMIVFYRKFDQDYRFYHKKPKHAHDRPGSLPPVEQTVMYKSANGIDWIPMGLTSYAGDNTTFFYNPFRKKWVYSLRTFSTLDQRVRVRGYYELNDFFNESQWSDSDVSFWSRTDIFDYPDDDLGYYTQLYGIDATPYESLMIGAFSVFMGPPNNIAEKLQTPKFCNLKLAYSRDGYSWDRGDYSDFIASSKVKGSYNCGYIHPVNGLFTVVNDEIYFYFSAFSGVSEKFGFHKYSGGSLGLATLRRDGFASMYTETKGTLLTSKIEYAGRYLFVNVDSSLGLLRCELLNKEGIVIDGYDLDSCQPVTVNKTKVHVQWENQSLLPVSDDPIQIRFELENGSLYSFWIADDEQGKSRGYMAAGGPGFENGRDI